MSQTGKIDCLCCNEIIPCDHYVIGYKNKKQTTIKGLCYLCVKTLCQGINISSKNPIISIIPKYEEIEN